MSEATTDPHRRLVAALAEEEDALLACVHCGFCLDACPTYTRLGDENDSPRGRLYLMRAVAEGRLDPHDEAFALHIDRCLGCRTCETVCPSGVRYGFLFERAREVRMEAQGSGLMPRLLVGAFGREWTSKLASAGGRLLRATGLPRLGIRVLPARLHGVRFGLAMLEATRASSGWRRVGDGRAAERGAAGGDVGGRVAAGPPPDSKIAGLAGRSHGETGRSPVASGTAPSPSPAAAGLPLPPSNAGSGFPLPSPHSGQSVGEAPRQATGPDGRGERVAMLTGCVQQGLLSRVNQATVRVLRANGCTVVDAPEQRCCGALHAHSGALDGARELARRNIDAFEAAGIERIIINAAGCGAMMKEYGDLLAHDPVYAERARAFAGRVRDLNEFLVELGPVTGGPLPVKVTYDAPCHLIHAQRIAEAPLELLRSIPELELVPLPGAAECCGGAGIYGVTHPELGGRILGDKVEAVASTGAEVVATPNPGCMMQIGAGLRLAGRDTAVVHPVELLDESYRRGGLYDD